MNSIMSFGKKVMMLHYPRSRFVITTIPVQFAYQSLSVQRWHIWCPSSFQRHTGTFLSHQKWDWKTLTPLSHTGKHTHSSNAKPSIHFLLTTAWSCSVSQGLLEPTNVINDKRNCFYHISIFVPVDEWEWFPFCHTAHRVLWSDVNLGVVNGFCPLWSSCKNRRRQNTVTLNPQHICTGTIATSVADSIKRKTLLQSESIPKRTLQWHRLHSTYSQALCQSFPLVLMASHSYAPTSSYCTLYRWSTAPDSLISWFGGRSVASTFRQTIWGMGLKRHFH